MRVTATKLRQNVYAILDEVLEKGIPVEVERKGKILKIVPEQKKSIWERLAALPPVIVDPSDDLEVNWLDDWREPENLASLEQLAAARKARKSRARKRR